MSGLSGAAADAELYLPKGRVKAIARQVLPEEAVIDEEALDSIQECVSEFIAFIASEAANPAPPAAPGRGVDGPGMIRALQTLGLWPYARAMELYLAKYRQYAALQAQRPEQHEAQEAQPAQAQHQAQQPQQQRRRQAAAPAPTPAPAPAQRSSRRSPRAPPADATASANPPLVLSQPGGEGAPAPVAQTAGAAPMAQQPTPGPAVTSATAEPSAPTAPRRPSP